MRAIVYTSQTGFTKKYAEMLAEKVQLPVYALQAAKKELPRDSEIFYMGWLSAGSVKGLDSAMDCYTIRGAAIVGLSPDGNGDLWTEAKINGGTSDGGARIFYLQGGYAPEKLKGLNRFLMKRMSAAVVKQLQAKGDSLTAADRRMMDLYQNGGDFVCEEALDQIVQWFAEGSHEGVLKPVPKVEI